LGEHGWSIILVSACLQPPGIHGWIVKINEIGSLLHATPFRPFVVHIADGGRLAVVHEDFVAIAPTGREMIVYQSNGSHQIVDTMLVTRLEVTGKSRNRKRRKRT
jgi:hypothetical protein